MNAQIIASIILGVLCLWCAFVHYAKVRVDHAVKKFVTQDLHPYALTQRNQIYRINRSLSATRRVGEWTHKYMWTVLLVSSTEDEEAKHAFKELTRELYEMELLKDIPQWSHVKIVSTNRLSTCVLYQDKHYIVSTTQLLERI